MCSSISLLSYSVIWCWTFFHVLICYLFILSGNMFVQIFIPFLKMLFIYIFLEKVDGREKERERETSMCEWYIDWSVALPQTGDLVCNPSMFPEWELNQWPSVHKPWLNPLSDTSQGSFLSFKVLFSEIFSPLFIFYCLSCYSCSHFPPLSLPHPDTSSPHPKPIPTLLSVFIGCE